MLNVIVFRIVLAELIIKMSSSLIKTAIMTAKAPKAIGPYSQAIKSGKTLFVSGQIGLIPKTMEFKGPDIIAQTEQVFENMGAILEEAGMNFDNIVKTTVLLADINDFTKMNSVYVNFFKEPFPARAAYAVATLPKHAKVEIEAIAVEK